MAVKTDKYGLLRTFTDEYGQLLPPGCRLAARRLVLAGANSIPGIPSIPGNSARPANYRSKQNCDPPTHKATADKAKVGILAIHP